MKGLWTGVECTQSGKSVSKVCFQLLVQAVDITASHPSAHQSAIRVADNSVDLLQSRDITLFEHFKRPPFLTERKAFRAGARYAQEISAVTVERPCDIVIASAYPNDYNLWQAGKALYTADLAVREGGIIILVSPLTEGIGEHDEFKQLLKCSYEEIEERIREGASPDIIGASAALAISLVRKRAELWIVSDGISDQEAQQMRVRKFSDLQEAVDQALARTSPSPEVLLVRDATEIFLSLDAKES